MNKLAIIAGCVQAIRVRQDSCEAQISAIFNSPDLHTPLDRFKSFVQDWCIPNKEINIQNSIRPSACFNSCYYSQKYLSNLFEVSDENFIESAIKSYCDNYKLAFSFRQDFLFKIYNYEDNKDHPFEQMCV